MRWEATAVALALALCACHGKKKECDRLIHAIHDKQGMQASCAISPPRSRDEADIAASQLDQSAKDFDKAARDMDDVEVSSPELVRVRGQASQALRDEQTAASRYATLARQFKPDGNRAWEPPETDCKGAESALGAALDNAGSACGP